MLASKFSFNLISGAMLMANKEGVISNSVKAITFAITPSECPLAGASGAPYFKTIALTARIYNNRLDNSPSGN